MNLKFDPSWGSHLPVLIRVMNISKGPVLELGTGLNSTSVLHWLCLEQDRELYSYENFPEYFEILKPFETSKHKVLLVEKDNWRSIPIDNTRWGVVFIDHHPKSRRGKEAIRLADKADYVIIHDSERAGNPFHYEEAYPYFKYRYTWDKQEPHTTVLSNFHDLSSVKSSFEVS